MGLQQNARFQEEICPENVYLDQIQNGRFPAVINFNESDIWQTVSDS